MDGFFLVSCQVAALLGLERHVGIGDFGDGGEEEDLDSEDVSLCFGVRELLDSI
jgi:hypothetical protein